MSGHEQNLRFALEVACNLIDSIEKAACGGKSCKICGEAFDDPGAVARPCPMPRAVDAVVEFRELLEISLR